VVTTTSNRNIEIAVCAKEYDRIRFEVRYLRNVRQIFSNRAITQQFPATFDGLTAVLDFLRLDARDRLGRLFSALPDLGFDIENPIHRYSEFIAAVARAGGGQVFAIERVLRLLTTSAAISPTGHDAVDQIIDRLTADGILQQARSNQREPNRWYHLTPEYQQVVLNALSGVERQR
jgi:hypothetical protein